MNDLHKILSSHAKLYILRLLILASKETSKSLKFSINEIAGLCRITPRAAEVALKSLHSAKILKYSRNLNRKEYFANQKHHLFLPLKNIIREIESSSVPLLHRHKKQSFVGNQIIEYISSYRELILGAKRERAANGTT